MEANKKEKEAVIFDWNLSVLVQSSEIQISCFGGLSYNMSHNDYVLGQ